MRFFSGFTLQNEAERFGAWLRRSDYTVAGFSFGAIKAAEYALHAPERIDTLQLLSPAFFQAKPERFKALQLRAYEKDPEGYEAQFLANCFKPCKAEAVERRPGSVGELRELMEYVWTPELLEAITGRGIRIEVYLGGEDCIIDARGAREFFLPHATVTWIPKANHFLQEQPQ